MHENLGRVRVGMAQWYDVYHQKSPQFKVGEKGIFDRRNVFTKWTIIKLERKKFRPFKVTRAVGQRAFELSFTLRITIQLVSHMSLLVPYCIPSNPLR